MKILELIRHFEKDCPISLQEEWDNSGIQIDFTEENLSGIVIGLDLSKELVEYAVENNCNFIFTHHPFFFNEIKSLNFNEERGKILELIINNKISVYAAHTNLDKINFGVSNILAKALNLTNVETLFKEKDSLNGFGKVGDCKVDKLINLAEKTKTLLNLNSLISYGDLDKYIEKIAVVGGSGAFAIEKCTKEGVNLLITGDIKYHDAQKALENNLAIFDIGHYNSEILIVDFLFKYLSKITDNKILPFKYNPTKGKII